jgi:hypothetical protein
MIDHKMQCSLFLIFADFANSICEVHYPDAEVVGGAVFFLLMCEGRTFLFLRASLERAD